MWKKAQLKLSSTLPSFQFQPQFLPLALQPSSPDTQGLHLTQVQTGVLLRAVRWCLRAQFNILCPAAPASRCGPRITEFTPPQPGSFYSLLRPRSVSLPFTRLLDLTTMLSYNKNPFFCQNKSFRKGTYAAWFQFCGAVREVKGQGWISFFSFPTLVSGMWSPLNLELLDWLD